MTTQSPLQGTSDTTNLTTYTFASQNFGTADAARYIICGVYSRAGGSSTVNSVTIGGVTATILTGQLNTSADSGFNSLAVAIAAVPTGTSGDVVVVFSAGQARCAMDLYVSTDLSSPVPTNIYSNVGTVPSVTIDVVAGGFAIGFAVFSVVAGTSVWTGLTEHFDIPVESLINATSASDNFVSAQTGLTVSVDSTSANGSMIVVAWGSAGGGGGHPAVRRFQRQVIGAEGVLVI